MTEPSPGSELKQQRETIGLTDAIAATTDTELSHRRFCGRAWPRPPVDRLPWWFASGGHPFIIRLVHRGLVS